VTTTVTLIDGTPSGTLVTVDGKLDPSLPLVVLLHGLGGSSLDMTDPATQYHGLAFDRTATFSRLRDEGLHDSLPPFPVARFFLDPLATTLTSWSAALTAAGFTVITYSQIAPQGLLTPNVTQLTALVIQILMTDLTQQPAKVDLRPFRVAFVGHSRGGLLARAFLVAAQTNPALSTFLPRVTSVITVHSPNSGSSLASLAKAVDGLLVTTKAAFSGVGVPAPPIIDLMRTITGTAGFAELVPGNATLALIAAGEPVPGVTYNTFGGTSTDAVRLWASVFTPDSAIPLPVPFPLFHWDSTPLVVGRALNAASFVPAAVLTPLPPVAAIVGALNALASAAPELRAGSGDLLVADTRARLPFAASHATNALNHLEALSDHGLQSQVSALLLAQRNPLVSGVAIAKLSPFPAKQEQSHQYRVVASDAGTGASLTPGVVTIRDGVGNLTLTLPPGGAPFKYDFPSTTVWTIDPDSGKPVKEKVWPTVVVELGLPYGSIDVDTGLP
jgi:acetyl esterase/lipase